MEQRRTRSTIRIEGLCDISHFAPGAVHRKSKKILSRYRDIRNMAAVTMRSEEEIKQMTMGLIREKFEKLYITKDETIVESLDYILSDILSLEYADDVIEEVFERMKNLNFAVEEYRPLIEYNYLYPKELLDEDIMIEIGMSKTSYYRKKKEAIILFGIILWNTMLERCACAIPAAI